jgi:hypothetical protein
MDGLFYGLTGLYDDNLTVQSHSGYVIDMTLVIILYYTKYRWCKDLKELGGMDLDYIYESDSEYH